MFLTLSLGIEPTMKYKIAAGLLPSIVLSFIDAFFFGTPDLFCMISLFVPVLLLTLLTYLVVLSLVPHSNWTSGKLKMMIWLTGVIASSCATILMSELLFNVPPIRFH